MEKNNNKKPNLFFRTWKWLMRNKFKIIILILLIGGGLAWHFKWFQKENTTTKQIKTKAEIGTIEKTIKVVGTAELVDEQELRFNQQGEVTVVNVKAGDTVKKGDIIAELDQEEALNTIKQNEISLANSRLKLQELLDGSTETQILQAKNTLESAEDKLSVSKEELSKLTEEQQNDIENQQKNLSIAKQELGKLIEDADIDVKQSETDIGLKQKSIEQQEKSLEILNSELELLKKQEGKSLGNSSINYDKKLEDAVSDVRGYINDFDKLIENVDIIFGVSDKNKNKNDDFEIYLSAKNVSLKAKIENQYYEIIKLLSDAKTKYNSISTKSDYTKEEVIDLLNTFKTIYEKMLVMGDDAKNAMYATISSSTYTENEINSHLNTVTSFYTQSQSNLNAIKQSINGLQTSDELSLLEEESSNSIIKKQNEIKNSEISLKSLNSDLTKLKNTLESTKKQNEIQIKSKQNEIQKLEDNLTLTLKANDINITTKQNDITSSEKNLTYYKENLNDVLDGATDEEIQQAQNDIAKQELALASAKTSLDKYKIEAPFDGVVRKIDFKVGDKITSDEEKYVYVENPNLLQMTALLDQIDIATVELGQEVRIVFDSYSDQTLTGTITDIDSTPNTSSGVTSYTVKVTLDKGELDIYSGMSAKMYIVIESAEDVVVIPSSYIEESGDQSLVLVDKGNNKALRKAIETGLTDGTNTQVLTGLNEGDTVIQILSGTTAATTTTSLFGPGSNRKSSSSSSSSNRSSNMGGGGGQGGPPGM